MFDPPIKSGKARLHVNNHDGDALTHAEKRTYNPTAGRGRVIPRMLLALTAPCPPLPVTPPS